MRAQASVSCERESAVASSSATASRRTLGRAPKKYATVTGGADREPLPHAGVSHEPGCHGVLKSLLAVGGATGGAAYGHNGGFRG